MCIFDKIKCWVFIKIFKKDYNVKTNTKSKFWSREEETEIGVSVDFENLAVINHKLIKRNGSHTI